MLGLLYRSRVLLVYLYLVCCLFVCILLSYLMIQKNPLQDFFYTLHATDYTLAFISSSTHPPASLVLLLDYGYLQVSLI